MRARIATVVLCGASAFCEPGPAGDPAATGRARPVEPPRLAALERPLGGAAAGVPRTDVERAACEARIRAVLAETALEGAPVLEQHRADLVWRAKAEPVLFLRTPRAADTGSEAQSYQRALARSAAPAYYLSRTLRELSYRHDIAQAVLLREGYLYAETPALGAALGGIIELHHLFHDPLLVIERGSSRVSARKGSSFFYEYAEGPEAGKRARLLLFDRVFPAGSEPGPALHADLRPLSAELAFERLEVERITGSGVVARLRYGSDWVRSLLGLRASRLALECEVVPAEAEQRVRTARELGRRRAQMLAALRREVGRQVDEALPFDEPKTEEGQQDGNLRPAWKWAYSHGWDSYTFNEDGYRVFDPRGRPLVPQVCIDFVMDTLERASGTWWVPRGAERARQKGLLDFDGLDLENRRSVDRFIDFARRHPEWFDVYALLPEERVSFARREAFFAHLFENRDRYRPGDVVAIHGPRGPEGEVHYHAFFVYDADPVTGMPTLVASNAGHPRVRSWESEMLSAPRRSIHTRVRLRLDWLETVIPAPADVSALDPGPSLSAPG